MSLTNWLLVLLLFVISLFLPQIVGFLSYRLLRKQDDLLAHLVGAMIPSISSF